MADTHLLRRGQVYWLDNCAPLDDDNAKRRPVVVVHVAKAGPALVVAVTTQHRSDEPDLIALPNRSGSSQGDQWVAAPVLGRTAMVAARRTGGADRDGRLYLRSNPWQVACGGEGSDAEIMKHDDRSSTAE